MAHETEEEMKINDEISDDNGSNSPVEELDDVEECGMSTMELDNLFEMFKWVRWNDFLYSFIHQDFLP